MRESSKRRRGVGAGLGLALWTFALAATPSAAQELASLPPEPPLPLEQIDHELAQIDALLATAHFRTVLGLAKSTRDWLQGFGDDPRTASRRARLEVMVATAEVALGRREPARRSLERALHADPSLDLDERVVSPKLVTLLPGARASLEGAAP